MNKQIALAYGIAGLAVAAALVSIVFATTQETLTQDPVTEATAQKAGTTVASEITLSQRVTPPEEAAPTDDQPVEYVYVDEPTPTGRNYKDRDHDDDDDDHDEDHNEDHDDDDGDRRKQDRGGRDD